MFDHDGIKGTLARVGLDCARAKAGEDGAGRREVQVVFLFRVPLTDAPDLHGYVAARHFPGLAEVEDFTRNNGGSYTTLLTRRWEPCCVKFSACEGGDPVFAFASATVKGKPRIVVVGGETDVEIQFRDRLGREGMARLAEFLDAEMVMDCHVQQQPLPLGGASDDGSAGTGATLPESEARALDGMRTVPIPGMEAVPAGPVKRGRGRPRKVVNEVG